jgi:uncharacterized membrane protein YcaP (DUF421 family)
MRLLGKRMSTQMSRLELCALVSLAASIGVPMLSTDRGILPAIIIAVVVIGITRLVSKLSYKSENFEQLTQGDIDILIEDGVMNYDVMKKTRISRERLFSQLRSENVDHIGEVKRLYIESNGSFSMIENENPKPGLMVLPEWDKEFIDEKLKTTDITICKNCGVEKPSHLKHLNGEAKCENCGEKEWTKAVTEASY